MRNGLGSLGDRLRVATSSDQSWQPQLHQLAERLAPLSAESRAAEWRDVMAEFIRRQETAGVPAETIGRRVTSMARLVGDLIVTIERNQADDEARRQLSAVERCVKRSPPPLDDVGGCEGTFDPLDPDGQGNRIVS